MDLDAIDEKLLAFDYLQGDPSAIQDLLAIRSAAIETAPYKSLVASFERGQEIGQQLLHLRNRLSAELYRIRQFALDQNVADHVARNPSQPGVEPLEFHG